MLRLLFAGALISSALVVEVAVLSRLPLPGATPHLALVVVVALAIGLGPGFGAISGFAAGLGADLVPPADSAIGRWALVLSVVGYAAGMVGSGMRRSVLVPVLVVAVAALGSVLGYAATGAVFGDSPVSWRVVKRLIPTAVLYAVVLSPFIVSAVLAVVRRLEPDPLIPD